MKNGQLQLKDIPDELVLRLAPMPGSRAVGAPCLLDLLVAEGFPEKLAFRKIEHLNDRGFLDYGVNPRFSWIDLDWLESLR